MTLPCIVCDKELESAIGSDSGAVYNQPYPGLVFTSPGNYGSTLYDPLIGGTEFLEVNICDACVEAKAASGKVLLVTRHQAPPKFNAVPFDVETYRATT